MRDFIPVFSDYRLLRETGITDSDAYEYRFQNVVFVGDGAGGVYAKARGELSSGGGGSADAAASRGRGIISLDNFNITVDEDTFYYSGGSTTITGGNDFYDDYLASLFFGYQSGVPQLINVNAGHSSTNASATHGNVWYTPNKTTAPTRITDADMPGNNGVSLTRGGAFLDGYLFVCDVNGQIHNSDLNDITAWTAANFLTAEKEPDIGVYLGKHHDNLVYIGTQSVEFFYNAANASGSPLAPRSDISYRIGCINPNTIVEVGDVIYFAGREPGKIRQIYKIENFQIQTLSTPWLDRTFGPALTPGDITSLVPLAANVTLAYTEDNHYGSALILNTATPTASGFIYSNGIWGQINMDNELTYGGLFPVQANSFPIIGQARSDSTVMLSNGATTTWNQGDSTDIKDLGESTAADAYIISPPWDGGTNRKKKINAVRVIHDPTATTAAVNFTLAWYDLGNSAGTNFNEADFTNGRQIDVSKTNNNVIRRCGTTRKRMFKMQFDDSGVAAIRGLEIDYEIVGE